MQLIASLSLNLHVRIHQSLNCSNIFSASPLKGVKVSNFIVTLSFTTLQFTTLDYTQQHFGDLKLCLKKLKSLDDSLLFCQTKGVVVKVYLPLSQCTAFWHHISMYHASLSEATKLAIQHRYGHTNLLKCVVSTVAFGLVSVCTTSLPQCEFHCTLPIL